MDNNRFFGFVQRFNSIVFMIAGVLAIIVLTFAGYRIFQDTTRTRHISNTVNMRNNIEITEAWEMSHPMKLDGTPFIILPFRSNQSYDRSYYDKSLQSIRNILFIDTSSNTQRWLYDSNDTLILSNIVLTSGEYREDGQKTFGMLYCIVASDTDNDRRLTRNDKQILAVSNPGGTNYTVLVENIDSLTGHHVVDEHTAYIFFMKDGEGYSAILSLDDYSLSGMAKLPAVG